VYLIYSWKNLLKSVEAMGVFDKSLKNLLKSVKSMGVFDIVMEKPAEVSRGDGFV
jgi:hypothetical protein